MFKRHLFGLAALGLAASSFGQFTLFAAETPSSSLGGSTSLYRGVQQYAFASTFGTATAGAGLPASAVSDPLGLNFHNGSLYVGNRHGNTLGQGSVQEFNFDGVNLSGGATIATASSASFQGFHGFDFAPNGDMFVTTVNSGTRRYRDSGSGYVDIGGVSSGPIRDVLLSPDGSKMIETTTNNRLRITEVLANGFGTTTTFVVGGASSMHQMALQGNTLYVTAFLSNSVHAVQLDANFNPISSSTVLSSSAPIGIAFSPDGQEMFVSSHTGNRISRYVVASMTPNGEIQTGVNMGYLAVPEPTTFAVLGLGALAALRRRRSR